MTEGVREIAPPFTATAKQLEVARFVSDPQARVVTAGGAIRSGKTQAAGRLVFEMAMRWPAVYLVARSTYRSLKDSTQKAMLHGDGSLPPLIASEAVEQYRISDEIVRLKNGAEILFRSLEEGQVGKLLNLTLGGVLVDQIEELDGGDDGERIFDTLLGRLSDPRGPRKLIAVCNPSGLTHWVYRRLVDESSRDEGARYVHFTLRDNARNLPSDYVAAMEATRRTRPHWYRSFILGQFGAFEGQAFAEFDEAIHVVPPFSVPDHWIRAESLDHGAANPTAHYIWATDEDGNSIAISEYHAPGLVSKHAQNIIQRRERFYPTPEPGQYVPSPYLWADPSIFANHGLEHRWGEPASVSTEYRELGIYPLRANNDRAAGYMRMLELLQRDETRPFPSWHPRYGEESGAPRLFFFATCKNAIAQLKSAPIAADGLDAGEAYDKKWANEHGHGVDAIRYFCITRPSPSQEAPRPPSDARTARMLELQERLNVASDYSPSDDLFSERLVDA